MAYPIAVFTALEGTLLDLQTFDTTESRASLARLLGAGIPIIPMSAMTLEEIEPIAAELGLRHAIVVEAGGAIARWRDGGWNVEPCGPPAETLLEIVSRIEDRSGANLLVYSAMEAADAARVSGRSGAMLQASTHRCFSEPFVIESGELDDIQRAAAELGFSVRRGQQFFHLCRHCDEGEAFARLRAELQCEVAIAVGASLLDAPFLLRANVAIVVPGAKGIADDELLAKVPMARVATAPGPGGWVAAVEGVVREAMTSRIARERHAASW